MFNKHEVQAHAMSLDITCVSASSVGALALGRGRPLSGLGALFQLSPRLQTLT